MGLRDPLSGIDVNERPWNGSADARTFAQQPGPGNPNVGLNGSDQARAFREASAPKPAAPPISTAPQEGGAFRAGRKLAEAFNSPVGQGIQRVLGAAGAVDTGLDAVTQAQQGDYAGALDNGLKSAAYVAATRPTPAALVGGAYLAGNAVGDQIYKRLNDTQQNGLGYAVNQGVRSAGKLLGQDWGVDDTKHQQLMGMDLRSPAPVKPASTPVAPNPTDLRLAAGTQSSPTGVDPRLATDPYSMTNAERAAAAPAGRITVRNGNEFSGSNVTGPVSYVDGEGKGLPGTTLRGKGGTVSDVSDPNVNSAMRMAMDQKAHNDLMDIISLRAQVMDRGAPPPGVRMGTGETTMSAAREKFAREVGKDSILNDQDISPVDRAHIAVQNRQVDATERGQDLTNRATLRGQDMLQGTAMKEIDQRNRTADLTYRAAVRGQDVSLQSHLLPKQMEMEMAMRTRQLNAAIIKQAGGDPRVAAQIASSYGMDGKPFLEMAQAGQTMDHNATKNADMRFEHHATVYDKDGVGKIDPAKMAIVRNIRDGIAPNYAMMSEREQAAVKPKVDAAINLVMGANQRTKTSLLQAIGVDAPNRQITTLTGMEGAQPEEVGFFGGMLPGRSRGDTALSLRDGRTLYIPRDKYNENEIDLVKKLR